MLTENAGVEGAEVVQITATDLDGDSITYSITSGNDDDYFIIDEDSGVVTLTAAGALALGNDALTDTNITLGVTASDGTATSEEQNVTISLSAVDDVTTLDLSLGEDLIEGASEVGAIVASFVVSDPDNIVTVDFADDTNDSGYYEINGNNIVLTDEGKVALDLGQSLPPISLVTSGSETQAVAKVKPTVNLINDAPVAVDDLASVIEDGGVITIDVLANDYDEEGDDINIISVSVPESQGTAIVSDGKILFTPALNFNGAATISYTISDGELTNSAEVSVSVSAVDDASVITGDTESVVYEEDSRVVDGLVFTNGNLTVTDVDIDDTPSFDTESVVSADGNLGSLVINEAGEWTYTVDAANELQHLAVGQTLIETFTIAATDGSTETISVTVRGQDDDSVIAEPNQVISFSEDIPSAYMAIPFSLTISDVDDGDTPRFETTTVQGDYGYVEYVESTTEVGSGIWTYHYDYDNGQTLESGIFTEIFTLTATDETEYKITVNINGVNDVPVVEATAEYLAIEGGDLLEGQVDATDVDSENLTFAVTSGEQPGFTLNSDGSWSFDPTVSAFDSLADGVTQDISVDVQVSDGTNTVSQTITITITGTNDVPTATEVVNESVVEGGTSISGVIDASDVDGDSLSYSIIGDTPAGFVLDGDSWTFDPSNVAYNSLAAGITETVSVEVLVDDGNGGTATQVVNLTVTGTNDTPTVDTGSVQSIDEVSLDSSSPNSIQGSYTVADSDGDSISISLVEPTSTYSSQGQDLVWSLSDDGSQLVGALAGLAIVTVALTDMTDEGGNYSVTLNGPIDHLSGASVENISLEFGIAIDDGVSSVTETISVTVNDDVPTAVTTEATLDLSSVTTEPDSAESYSISSISGSFSSADFTSAANKKTGSIDVDQDGDVDYVGWKDTDGKYFSYSSNSNYYADDADSQSDIAMGENFVVAEFTHNNTGINSNYSTLDSVDFDMTFTVEIDGVETSVSLTLPLDHDETLNTLNNGNDTVTITSLPSTTVELNGVTYEVSLTGFMDSNGNLVTTISTPEESSSTYSIVANIDVLTADIDGATGSIDDGTVIDDSIDEVNDTASTILSGTVDIDAGADGLANVVANSTTDVNGTLVISEDGSYIFTPSTELINSDTDVTLTYQYTVLDNDGDSVVNTLTIDVVGSPAENTAPEAADDVSVGDEDSVITIDVLVNDSDAENDGLTITSATVAEELGTVEIVNGKLEFTPADDFSGEVTIDYAISDGELTSQASVTVTVDAVADAPTLEVELSDAVSQGSITLNPDDISSLGEVRSEGYVNGVTSRDSREVDFAFGEEYAGQTVTISFDSFISGGWEDGSNGSTVDTYTILVNGEQVNQYTYEQNTGTATHNQQDSYQVALDDEGNATVQFITHTTDILETVDITNIQASVDSTTSISQLTIKGASTDADGSEVLSYEISALPEGANLLDADGAVITANADGSYSLTAYEADGLQISTSQDASGFDIEVTVTATDGQSTSQTSQTVTVEDSNTNPVAIDDYGFAGLVGSYYGTDTQIDSLDEFINVIANNDPTATFNATNIDYSSNGSTSEATSVATGTNLQTFLGDDADSLSSDPDDNTDGGIHLQGYIFLAAGTYNFQVYADDGYQISIDGENVASVSNNQSPTSTTHQEFEIAEDGYYAIDMIWWDQGGNYVFQPSISSDGGETYTTLDSSMLSSIKGAPLSTDDEHSITINPETLLANDSDADGDVLSISSISDVQDGYAYLNSEGSVVFIAAAGFTGTASFDYTITDGNGGFDTATAFVEVTESAILPTVTVTLSETQETSAGGNGWGGFTADDENISTPTNDEGNYTTWESYTSDSENIYIEENVTASLQTQGGNDQVVIGGNAVEYINLGAGDDKIRIEGTLGSDDIETSLDAGAGNDDVYIDGDVKEYINLGNGDDLLVIGGLVEWEIESGDGNDSLLLNGYTAATYATEKSLPTSKLESRISDFTNIMLGDGTVIKGDASAFDDYFTGSTSDTDIPTYSYDLNVDINNENATAEGATVNLFGIPATVTVLLNGETLTSNTDGSYSIDVEQDQTSISGLSIVSDAELPEFEVTSTVTNRVDETDVDVDEIIATDSFQSGTDAIDTLVGLDGDDVLFGGDDEAADILTGGAGNDVFILNDVAVQSNIDTITDFNAADDALDLTDLLSGIEGNPGKDADMDAITEFLEAHVKVEDGAVKVDDEDVAKFGVDDDSLTDSVTTSFDSNGDGSVNSSDSIKVIYNNEEYNINIDG
ncbi:tandem-95 repeat protein [Marinomonas sp.]